MNKVFIEPGKSNPGAAEEGHWKIMFEENGKARHLNDGKSKPDAVEKAQRAASKRGVDFEGGVINGSGEEVIPVEVVKKHYMDVSPPRGAPKIGATVAHRVGSEVHIGQVVDYLSDQFVIEYQMTTSRVVHINEDWKVQ